jgi:hypothetical protein
MAMASFSSNACPASNRVGRCMQTVTASGVTLVEVQNYYPPVTAAAVMTVCASENSGNIVTTFIAN